jgi:glycosyltransferase involved in cell wall biosynthesis
VSSSASPGASDAARAPFLTVLTPAYESAAFLKAAVDSVARAGIPHVVMDGGSGDGTLTILEEARGVTWRSEPDSGQSHALNKALAETDSTWIGWLNADEFYLPGVLEWVTTRLARGDVDVLFGDFAEVDVDGRLLRLVTNHGWSRSILRRVGCYVPSCAAFIRRELLEQVGGWREDLATIMDWELWLRLDAAGARFGYAPVVVAGFTRHAGQVTARETVRSRSELAGMQAQFGIEDPTWRRQLARLHRIVRKTLNGGYLRELSVRPLAGAPLLGPADDPRVVATLARINPRIDARSVRPGRRT